MKTFSLLSLQLNIQGNKFSYLLYYYFTASIISADHPRCKNIINFDGDDAPNRLRPFRVSKKAGILLIEINEYHMMKHEAILTFSVLSSLPDDVEKQ